MRGVRGLLACVVGLVVGCRDDAASSDAGAASTGEGTDAESSSSGTGDVDPTVERTDTSGSPIDPDIPTTIPGDGPFGAGTRLHPIVQAAGAEHRLMHWYDTELAIECDLVRDAAGDVRCLPHMPEHLTAGFATDDCASAVLRVGACGTAPAFVRAIAPDSAACLEGARHLTYRTAAPRSSLADVYAFDPRWPGCHAIGSAPGVDYELDRVDDEMFARAHWVVEPGEGGIGVRALVGEDGSWQRIDLVDDAIDTVCDPGVWQDDDDAVRIGCIPRVPDAVVHGFASQVCHEDELVGVPQDGTCLPVTAVRTAGADGESKWIRLGELHDDVAYEATEDQYCIPFEPDVNLAFHRPGPTFPLAPIDIEHVLAPSSEDSRLQRWALAIGDERIVVTDGAGGSSEAVWYDAVLESSCTTILTDDGRRVCVPGLDSGPADDDVLWGDPACNEIELRIVHDDPPPMIGFTRHGGCTPILEGLRNVVGVYDGPVYAIDPGTDDCIAAPVPEYGTIVQLGNVPDIEVLATLEVLTLSP
jgi:hypothetical protein